MSRTSNKTMKSATAALVVAAIVAPNAEAAYQDLRSPDARDAATASATTQSQDLRSPDARDAALASEARNYQDLRSPDARDSGRVVSSASPAPTPGGEPSGSGWDDVDVIAGGGFGLVLIGLGGLVLFTRRRNAVRKSGIPVVSS